MAEDRSVDERAPLLDRETQLEAGEAQPSPKEERTWTSLAWKTVWTVLGVFVLAVFIKGFIDADDVDVSHCQYFPGYYCSGQACVEVVRIQP